MVLTDLCSRVNRALDELLVNAGFDFGCEELRDAGSFLARAQNGRVQHYLRILGLAFSLLVLALIWGMA